MKGRGRRRVEGVSEVWSVAVLGGTPGDVKLGRRMLEDRGISTLGFATAGGVGEQSCLQEGNAEGLTKKVLRAARSGHERGCCIGLVYCNSLSLAVDWNSLVWAEGVPEMVTPLPFLLRYTRKFARPLVLTANLKTAEELSWRVAGRSGESRASVVAVPEIIEGVEEVVNRLQAGWQCGSASYAIERACVLRSRKGLKEIARLAQSYGSDAVVLGCTHLGVLGRTLRGMLRTPVCDPGEDTVRLTAGLMRGAPGGEIREDELPGESRYRGVQVGYLPDTPPLGYSVPRPKIGRWRPPVSR